MITGIEKASAVTSEYLSGVNPINAVASPFAALAGLLTPTRTEEEQEREAPSGVSNALVPGVGAYNYTKRLGHMASRAPHGYAHTGAEVLGGIPSRLAISALAGNEPRHQLPAGLAMIAPEVLGMIAAGITPRRSLKEQREHDTGLLSTAQNLIPGLSTYNLMKRLGASKNIDEQGMLKHYQDKVKQEKVRS